MLTSKKLKMWLKVFRLRKLPKNVKNILQKLEIKAPSNLSKEVIEASFKIPMPMVDFSIKPYRMYMVMHGKCYLQVTQEEEFKPFTRAMASLYENVVAAD